MDNDTRPRRILKPINPAVNALLDTLPVEVPQRRTDLREWTEGLIASVRRFTNTRRFSGAGPTRLSKDEAKAALFAALSLVGGHAQ